MAQSQTTPRERTETIQRLKRKLAKRQKQVEKTRAKLEALQPHPTTGQTDRRQQVKSTARQKKAKTAVGKTARRPKANGVAH